MAALALSGLALMAGYVFSAVIDRMGEPDQSLLFWYLPLLFIGLSNLILGLGAGGWGLHRLRTLREPKAESDAP